jgi:dUTP pyrophosphatase
MDNINIYRLLNIYEKVMVLKVFVDTDDINLRDNYIESSYNHNNKMLNELDNIDAGFDLFAPGNADGGTSLRFYGTGWDNISPVNKLDYKICCSAQMFSDTGKTYNTGYYMYPRSSLSKTPLRLANSTGIIDSGYRGHLIGMFDVVNINDNLVDDADYIGAKYDRYLQICAPGLVPIIVEIVSLKSDLGDETSRGEGGFGSTGH